MPKAIFWDRDGVLNQIVAERSDGEKNASPQKFEDFKLVEGVAEVLQGIKALGYLNIVVTKQPDIARKKMKQEELNKMHEFLKQEVPGIDAIYVCPHDDNDNCDCRKPKPGLLLDAAKDYHLDLSKCYMVGDQQNDIGAAKSAGVKSVLLRTNYNGAVRDFTLQSGSLKEILRLLPHSNS